MVVVMMMVVVVVVVVGSGGGVLEGGRRWGRRNRRGKLAIGTWRRRRTHCEGLQQIHPLMSSPFGSSIGKPNLN